MSRLPFILSRDSERAAVERAVRDPRKRQMLYEMVDAVLRVCETRAVSPAELAPILALLQGKPFRRKDWQIRKLDDGSLDVEV